MRRSAPAAMLTGAVWLLGATGCDDDLGDYELPPMAPASAPSVTTTTESPPAVATRPAPPHDGELLPLPDHNGYVEWLPNSRRIYLLDAHGAATDNARLLSLFATGTVGPRELALKPCTTDGESSCWVVSDDSEWRSPDAAVLRGEIARRPFRVLLKLDTPIAPPESAPAGATVAGPGHVR